MTSKKFYLYLNMILMKFQVKQIKNRPTTVPLKYIFSYRKNHGYFVFINQIFLIVCLLLPILNYSWCPFFRFFWFYVCLLSVFHIFIICKSVYMRVSEKKSLSLLKSWYDCVIFSVKIIVFFSKILPKFRYKYLDSFKSFCYCLSTK